MWRDVIIINRILFFVEKLPFGKDTFLELMKTNMWCRLKAIDTKLKIVSQEITIHDKYVHITYNIDGFKFNDTRANKKIKTVFRNYQPGTKEI